jgi:uncharacterized RDD family membrane protein YckC
MARLGDRFLGLLIDSIPLSGVSIVLASHLAKVGTKMIFGFKISGEPSWAPYMGFMALSFVYFSVLEGTCGWTLGKALVGIKVQSLNGEKCHMRASLIRNLFRLIDGLGGYLLGFLVALFSRSRQRLGDYLADTVVVERDLSMRWKALAILLWSVLTIGAGYEAYVLHSWLRC